MGRRRNHKMKLAQFVAISCLLAVSSSAPQRRRNQNNVNTKFFTGNNAIDSAAWGAALGAGIQYFANQVLNPCRGGNKGGTRGGNQGTNTRFFLGNNNPVGNGLLGFLGGSERLQSPTLYLGTPVVEYNYSV